MVVPQGFDPFCFVRRVDRLGIGGAHPATGPTPASLTGALRRALDPGSPRPHGPWPTGCAPTAHGPRPVR
ncbi:hypothetical protein AB0D54_10755 [Streptomyces xanthophaeus]|uniref:hypothetical protein n=1 Tax=Streptomyces xanthophaeus TaxID=67385 RepID=UPI00343CA26B